MASPPPKQYSPLQQHPLPSPRQTSRPPTPPTETLILSHPSARLSSSPASSPRLVESPPARTRSIRPEMIHPLDRGASPGAGFFEDSSSDNSSEWEDDNGTRQFSTASEMLNEESASSAVDFEELVRGRRQSNVKNMSGSHKTPARDSGGSEPLHLGRGIDRANQMSLRRLGKVKVVHNHRSGSPGGGTSRDSLISNDSNNAHSVQERSASFPELRGGDSAVDNISTRDFRTTHRRNTSESFRADSILNAHVITMKALESLPSTASLSRAQTRSRSLPKSSSFSEQRRVVLPRQPLPTQYAGPNRQANQPAHFIKTPCPFSAKKEFPKPKTRPRQLVCEQDKGEYGDMKGNHVLGIVASDGELDLRSRFESNEEAQGFRTRKDNATEKERWGSDGTVVGTKEATLWLTLRKKRRHQDGLTDKIEKMMVPHSLMTTSPERSNEKKNRKLCRGLKNGNEADGDTNIDFDDMMFAQQLRAGYNHLAGPWFLRASSAKKLRNIRLGQVSAWSGMMPDSGNGATGRLLMTHEGFDMDIDARSSFTEKSLRRLYQDPKSGKGRYTWVSWARRVAAWNASVDATACPDSVVAVQFQQSFSTCRIMLALGAMLALSVLSMLLWIFLGESAWTFPEKRGKADRVAGGSLLGMFVLLMQSLVFAVWLAAS